MAYQQTRYSLRSSTSSTSSLSSTSHQQSQPQSFSQPPSQPFNSASSSYQSGGAWPSQYAPEQATQSDTSTSQYLDSFSLLAEAAKRAQMQCLVRDFGECGL